MGDLPHIATLWVGSTLSWMEKLTLQSFVHRGHAITLFHTDPIENMDVDGVELADPREIFPYSDEFKAAVAPSFMADLFRIHLLRKSEMVWVDTDALCYRPFRIADDYLFAWSPYYGQIPNGVLRVPNGSPALNLLIEFLDDPGRIPPWMKPGEQDQLRAVDKYDRLVASGKISRTAFGPPAWTWALRQTEEIDRALKPSALYPYPWYLSDIAFNPHGGVEGWISDDTMSVHLYTAQVRRWNRNRRLLEGCFLEKFMKEVDYPEVRMRPLSDTD